MSPPSTLTKTLRAITGTSKKKGLGLRPSKKLLRLLHLSREYAAAIAFRPISFGNARYLQERVEELHILGREIQDVLPSLADEWRAVAAHISSALMRCTTSDSQQLFASIVQACDSTYYRRFWERATTPIPAYAEPVLSKSYDNIIVVTGPAIGLGDEISCANFMRHLRKKWPLAHVDIYGFYTGLWQTIDPTFVAHSINGDPLRFFAAINDIVRQEKHRSTLVLFINFTGLSFHLLFCMDSNKPDLLEIAVGRGMAWFTPSQGGPIQTLSTHNAIYPNNYTSLRVLQEKLLGATQHIVQNTKISRPPKNGVYRVVINPLTSKPIVLTPSDWAFLIAASYTTIPHAKPLHCIVLPGLTQQSYEYAQATVHEIKKLRLPHCTAEILNGNGPLDSATAFTQVTHCINSADILIGIDTYTAHLAPMLSIPSIALCYERNIAFWSPSDKAFWVELQHNINILAEIVSLIMQLTGASRQPMPFTLPNPDILAALQECLLSHTCDNSYNIQTIIEAYDAVWHSLPLSLQKVLKELDQSYAWSVLREWLPTLYVYPNATQWILQTIEQLHFSKVCRLIATYQRSIP